MLPHMFNKDFWCFGRIKRSHACSHAIPAYNALMLYQKLYSVQCTMYHSCSQEANKSNIGCNINRQLKHITSRKYNNYYFRPKITIISVHRMENLLPKGDCSTQICFQNGTYVSDNISTVHKIWINQLEDCSTQIQSPFYKKELLSHVHISHNTCFKHIRNLIPRNTNVLKLLSSYENHAYNTTNHAT